MKHYHVHMLTLPRQDSYLFILDSYPLMDSFNLFLRTAIKLVEKFGKKEQQKTNKQKNYHLSNTWWSVLDDLVCKRRDT